MKGGLCLLPIPNLNQAVAPSRHKSPLYRHVRLRAHHRPRHHRRRPADGIDTRAMRLEDLMIPVPLLKLEHADPAVRRRTREQAPALVRRPGHNVHRRRVQAEIRDPLPGILRRGLAPDEDLAVVGTGGEDGAVFGVRLS